jgi:hypothetical protein
MRLYIATLRLFSCLISSLISARITYLAVWAIFTYYCSFISGGLVKDTMFDFTDSFACFYLIISA